MFCPNCGSNNTAQQSFCRSCGFNLEKTAESLLEQIPSAESEKLMKKQTKLEKFGNIAFGGFGLVLLTAIGGIIYWIITQIILDRTNIFTGVLLIAFLIFAVLTLIYVVLNEVLKEKKQKTNPALENVLQRKIETAKLLEEKHIEPILSVTDSTTNLLFVEPKRKTSGELK